MRQNFLIDFDTEPRHIELDYTFWVAPYIYRDFLWFLSTSGAVYRLSLLDNNAKHVGEFGVGFGKTPFVITEVANDVSMKDWTPYLISANPGSIAGIDLLTGQTKQFLRVEPNERILSSFENDFVALLADSRHAYFLKKREPKTYLSICDLLTAKYEDYELGDQPVAGPFKMENRIGVYFRNSDQTGSVIVLEQDGRRGEYPLPRNLKPCLSWDESKDLHLPFCRMPYMSRGNSVYIPGIRDDSVFTPGAPSDEGGLLFFLLDGSTSKSGFISAKGEASCWQDSAGRPVIARNGEITFYEGAGAKTVYENEQLIAKGPAFHENNLTIGFARSGGGGNSLRFYKESKVFDYPLANLPDFQLALGGGFYQGTGALAFVYRTRNSFMRALVWDMHAG